MHSLSLPEALIDSIGWALVHFLWQGALGGVLAAGVLVAMKRCSASARYLVAVAALFVLALLPVATVLWSDRPLSVIPVVKPAAVSLSSDGPARAAVANVSETGDETAVARAEVEMPVDAPLRDLPTRAEIRTQREDESHVVANESTSEVWGREQLTARLQPYLPSVVSVWLVGVSLLSLRLLVGWVCVQRLKRKAQQPAGESLQALLKTLIERLKVSRPVRLVESALVEVPTVIGWLTPVILIPATALSGLSTSQLEALLAHELAHVRRNDYLINLMQSVIETLLFYHPVVWWLSRRIRIEREHCCDDLAVQVCGDELSYAKALVALEELRGPQLKLAMSADGGSLLGRVSRLLGRRRQDDVSRGWVAGVVLVLAGVLVLWTRTTLHATPQNESDFSIQLRLGGPVRLVGVSTVGPNRNYWRPDGTPMAAPDFESRIRYDEQQPDLRAVLFEGAPVGYEVRLESPHPNAWNHSADRRRSESHFAVGRWDRTANLRAQVLPLNWRTIAISGQDGLSTGDVVIRPPVINENGEITVKMEFITEPDLYVNQVWRTRLIALKRGGDIATMGAWESSSGIGNWGEHLSDGKHAGIEAHFSELKLEDVECFVAQRREPLYVVEFRNVALHPGHRSYVTRVLDGVELPTQSELHPFEDSELLLFGERVPMIPRKEWPSSTEMGTKISFRNGHREVLGDREFLVGELHNYGSSPIEFREGDFQMVVDRKYRIFAPPSLQMTGKVLPPNGRMPFRIDWSEFVRYGRRTSAYDGFMGGLVNKLSAADRTFVDLQVGSARSGEIEMTIPRLVLAGKIAAKRPRSINLNSISASSFQPETQRGDFEIPHVPYWEQPPRCESSQFELLKVSREIKGRDEFVVVTIRNSGDKAVTFREGDFNFCVAQWSRLFAPSALKQTEVTLQPQEERTFELNWPEYVRLGQWALRDEEITEQDWELPPSSEFVTVRVTVGWTHLASAFVTLPRLILSGKGPAVLPPEKDQRPAQLLAMLNQADVGADKPAEVTAADLIRHIKQSSWKYETGRMRVEWGKVTDESWVSGKKGQEPVKTSGKIAWRNEGKQWRVDFDGELPNSGAGGKVTNSPDLWSTGFDGERFYDFDRYAKSLVIGGLHQSARVYEPANLFWNPANGGVESVLDVLRKPGVTVSKATLDGLEGYRVERVVERDGKWKWSAFVCPSRSYLTLEIQQRFNEQLNWECKLSDLREVQPGVWYPQKIRRTSYNGAANGQNPIAWQNDYTIAELELGVEAAQSWPTFAERTAGFAHPTSKVPYGIHINDLTRGSAYFNDPWWQELEPILKQKHGWPKTSLLPLEDVKSQFEKTPTATFRIQSGGALPKFETKDGNSLVWTAGPDEKKPQPKVTLVLFWAPWEERSVKALVAAKRLHEELSKHGLQVVAVQDTHQAAKTPAAFLKALALPFPSILDEFPEVEGDLGKDTIRKTLGVRGMPTGCLLDHADRVIAIEDGSKLLEQIAGLLKAARQSLDPSRSQAEPGNELPKLTLDAPLAEDVGRAAEAEWKQLVAKAEPRTHIKGRVVNEKNVPMAAVVVEVRPQLKLARGGYGGLMVYPDFKATKTFRTNAGGVFEAQSLPKGSYEVRVKAGGYAARKFDVFVGPGQPGELGDVVLDQRDAISGFVVDDNGKVLVGAKVEALWRHTDPKNVAIKTRSPGAMPKTTVRGDGSFFLNELEAGRYTLEFDADGHEREVREAVSLGGLFGKVWLDAYPEPLQRKVSLKLQDATLLDALQKLSEQAKVELEVDSKIEIEGLTRNSPEPFKVQSFEVQDKPLGDALEVLLAPFDVSVRLGFAWDGKKVFVSTHEAAKRHRLPPLETVKGAPRERYAQLARERAMQELQTAEEAVGKTPGSIAPLALKKLKQMVEVTRIEHEIALHDNSQVLGQPITAEFRKKSNDLLIARVEAAIVLNKLELEIADEANKQKPGSVKEEELQRLKKLIEDLEKDLERLTGKPMAKAPTSNSSSEEKAAALNGSDGNGTNGTAGTNEKGSLGKNETEVAGKSGTAANTSVPSVAAVPVPVSVAAGANGQRSECRMGLEGDCDWCLALFDFAVGCRARRSADSRAHGRCWCHPRGDHKARCRSREVSAARQCPRSRKAIGAPLLMAFEVRQTGMF